jgi:hypothetical protein
MNNRLSKWLLSVTLLVALVISPATSKDSGGSNQTRKTSVAEDKNWGDKQTSGGKSNALAPSKSKSKIHEKEGKFGLEKEKIDAH